MNQENVLSIDHQRNSIMRTERSLGAILVEDGKLSNKEIDRVLDVPAQTVTSLCFAGGDQHDLYVVTADNTDVPDRRGTIFRVTAGVGGAPVHPARI